MRALVAVSPVLEDDASCQCQNARALRRSCVASLPPGLPPKTDAPPPAAGDAAAPAAPPDDGDASLGELSNLTLDAYADQLKRARQMAGLASMLPKGMLGAAGAATDASVGATLKKQEDVIRCVRCARPFFAPFSDAPPCCAVP